MTEHRSHLWFGLLLATALAGGCASGKAGAGPWVSLPNEPTTQPSAAELTYSLVNDPAPVTQNRAYHAFIVWAEGKDDCRNFGQRVARLEEQRVLDPHWTHDPLRPLTRGRLASMICRKMNIRGSVALILLGPNERAARRELIFRNIMPAGGGDWDGINGAEFVNVLKKADEASESRDEPGGGSAGEGVQ